MKAYIKDCKHFIFKDGNREFNGFYVSDHYTSHKFILFWWKSFINETFNVTTSQNDNLDIIMDDAIQKEEKKLSFYNNEKLGDHDIDIEMKILHQEENIFLLNINNNDENIEKHQYHTNPFKLKVETILKNNTTMDIDSLNYYIGEGPNATHQNDKAFFGDNYNNNNPFEDQDKEGDKNVNIAMSEDEGKEENEDDLTNKVLLISHGGKDFVASSKVDDYKHCPEAYSSSSLYQWSKLSVKVKVSLAHRNKIYLPFYPVIAREILIWLHLYLQDQRCLY